MTHSTLRLLAVTTCAAAALAVAGCSSDSSDSSSPSTSSATSSSASASTAASSPSTGALVPRDIDATGTNFTIADYIKQNNIVETPLKPGAEGAPTIDLPMPEGWSTAGDKTPDYAYAAIEYTGPDASQASYQPNFIALLSKLEGTVDAQALIEAAPGEIKNLKGASVVDERTTTLSGYPAYDIAATYDLEGTEALSAQKTVIIPGDGVTYILQLNGTSDQAQAEILGAAAKAIDGATISQ
ncbi:MAG: LpqN/LpqT family lipoprotein [Corynebacteriales bacterium]|uniref:LpqN/LpqT family lipoprotein n=1 Tax=Williamsia herbipolensis TaxID=1603258 RepID=A0AAU4K216_9NOCA|nr:LpqN/LpqT family lipoprotein [Williamsia herbipolensis]MCX6470499.1 LpqN/LpqT family lipoprotein [Mycobacteriales bacterium]